MDAEQKIVAAVIAGAAAAATSAVKDTYQALKTLITGRFKSKAGIEPAIEGVEQKPDSKTWTDVLADEIKVSGVASDREILAKAEELLALAEKEGLIETSKGRITVKHSGSGVIAIGNRSVAGGAGSLNVGGSVYGNAFSDEFDKRWKSVVKEDG